MSDKPFHLSLAERMLNGLLQRDAEILDQLRPLAGKIVSVEITNIKRTLYILLDTNGVELHRTQVGPVSASVRGDFAAFRRMAVAHRNGRIASSAEIEIMGDLALAQQLQTIASAANLDWEELLSRYLGDVTAHKLGNLGRGFMRWSDLTSKTLHKNLSEMLRIEKRMVPEKNEMNGFVDAVDSLRSDADRLHERLRRLLRRSMI
jgi:ubiquinone biosynthesis protein UbiJ